MERQDDKGKGCAQGGEGEGLRLREKIQGWEKRERQLGRKALK